MHTLLYDMISHGFNRSLPDFVLHRLKPYFHDFHSTVPPQWETPLTDVSADIYSEATMQCVAVSPDGVSYEWFLNSESLTSRDRHSFSTNKETLTITNLARTDTAIYQCVAKNEFGSAFSTGQLTVRGNSTFFMNLCNCWHNCRVEFSSTRSNNNNNNI